MPELSARDTKLIQYLNEAYGKEKQLEEDLRAHIAMTQGKDTYKKRLQQHFKETKDQSKALERRIKKLGGKAELGPELPGPYLPGPDVAGQAAGAVTAVASRAKALARGPIHTLRGTSVQEKLLKNAQTEFSEEHHEIAMYTAIEALAESVGDKDTVKLARDHRRQEERMAAFLQRLIPQLTKDVARAEIPAAERKSTSTRRRTGRTATSRRRASSSARKPASSSRRSASSSGSRARRSSSS